MSVAEFDDDGYGEYGDEWGDDEDEWGDDGSYSGSDHDSDAASGSSDEETGLARAFADNTAVSVTGAVGRRHGEKRRGGVRRDEWEPPIGLDVHRNWGMLQYLYSPIGAQAATPFLVRLWRAVDFALAMGPDVAELVLDLASFRDHLVDIVGGEEEERTPDEEFACAFALRHGHGLWGARDMVDGLAGPPRSSGEPAVYLWVDGEMAATSPWREAVALELTSRAAIAGFEVCVEGEAFPAAAPCSVRRAARAWWGAASGQPAVPGRQYSTPSSGAAAAATSLWDGENPRVSAAACLSTLLEDAPVAEAPTPTALRRKIVTWQTAAITAAGNPLEKSHRATRPASPFVCSVPSSQLFFKSDCDFSTGGLCSRHQLLAKHGEVGFSRPGSAAAAVTVAARQQAGGCQCGPGFSGGTGGSSLGVNVGGCGGSSPPY